MLPQLNSTPLLLELLEAISKPWIQLELNTAHLDGALLAKPLVAAKMTGKVTRSRMVI